MMDQAKYTQCRRKISITVKSQYFCVTGPWHTYSGADTTQGTGGMFSHFYKWLCTGGTVGQTRKYRPKCTAYHESVAAPAFFEWGGQRGAKKLLGGQNYMVANNALRQYGTHTPLFQVSLSFPWSLFSLCFLWFLSFHLSFIPTFRPSPRLVQLGVWGSAVSSPSVSGWSPAAKCNLVNSGPRNERFLTCQSGKVQCFLNSLILF